MGTHRQVQGWTRAEVERAEQMRAEGHLLREIAKAIGKSKTVVGMKLTALRKMRAENLEREAAGLPLLSSCMEDRWAAHPPKAEETPGHLAADYVPQQGLATVNRRFLRALHEELMRGQS